MSEWMKKALEGVDPEEAKEFLKCVEMKQSDGLDEGKGKKS